MMKTFDPAWAMAPRVEEIQALIEQCDTLEQLRDALDLLEALGPNPETVRRIQAMLDQEGAGHA